jgi:TRAP-type C4-dicarboxylate transport system substrate-binding protein
MKILDRRAPLLLALLLLMSALAAQPLTLKVGAFVPPNSPWDLGLKRLAAEFDRVSGGQVKIVFPASLKSSSEEDIIQKMRLGVDGALLTTPGLAQIYPDALALSMPAMVGTDAEFDAMVAAFEPIMRADLKDKYEILGLIRAGWIHFFSKKPIVVPADFEKLRLAAAPGDELISKVLQSLGARTTRLDNAGLILQLGANGVDAFYSSPLFVSGLWQQFKGKIAYMSSFNVSAFVGAIVFTRQSWDKIPANLRPALFEVARQIGKEMALASGGMEASAIDAITREGIQIPPSRPENDRLWEAAYAERKRQLFPTMFSAKALSAIETTVQRVRSGK